MFEKPEIKKESMVKLIAAVIIASVFLLTISILTDDHDSRKQISDDNGATESALCSFLSEIKGVGEVNVMIRYGEESKVSGVIVTAQGAEDPVVRSSIVKGVSTLFDIPVSSVMVFEKNQEEKTK
ncbi:hypothetical protein ACPW7J_07580 [Ihubacter sp. rT4E-8]|uniref:hypothetical protein n=1 Tax=unclassified Ihubacter TaxID=2633299 RepID=UPI00137B0C5E